jgi:RHS repeat-associated protein
VLQGDYQSTGQNLDTDTGLMYYGARYYDRQVGTFILPDTLVPDSTNVWDYNRFLYVRGNPLKYSDLPGYSPTSSASMGPAICLALFIELQQVAAGIFTLHRDGRDFSNRLAFNRFGCPVDAVSHTRRWLKPPSTRSLTTRACTPLFPRT